MSARIKIKLDSDVFHLTPILKVEYYKTEEAYYDPINHPDQCCNCVIAFHLNNPEETKFSLLERLLENLEMVIERVLNHQDDKEKIA